MAVTTVINYYYASLHFWLFGILCLIFTLVRLGINFTFLPFWIHCTGCVFVLAYVLEQICYSYSHNLLCSVKQKQL